MKNVMGDAARFIFGFGLGAAMLSLPVGVKAQAPPQPPPPQDAAPAQETGVVIKRESKLVLVDAVVTDKKGKYVRDLTANDFKVFEDSKEQAISSFSTGAEASNQPVNVQTRRYVILFF